MSDRHAGMLQRVVFCMGHNIVPSNHEPSRNKKVTRVVSPFRLAGPFLESGRVKSDTLSWACVGFATPRLWNCDTLMSPQCQLVEDMTPSPSPSAISWHILRNCQNTLEMVQNWVQAANGWQGDAAARNGGARFSDIRNTLQSLWIFVGIPLQNGWI